MELLQLPNEMLAVSLLCFTNNEPLSQAYWHFHSNKEAGVHCLCQMNTSFLHSVKTFQAIKKTPF